VLLGHRPQAAREQIVGDLVVEGTGRRCPGSEYRQRLPGTGRVHRRDKGGQRIGGSGARGAGRIQQCRASGYPTRAEVARPQHRRLPVAGEAYANESHAGRHADFRPLSKQFVSPTPHAKGPDKPFCQTNGRLCKYC